MPHHLLLVDDEAIQRSTLAGFLSKRGYHVHEAGDGRQALDLLGTVPVDAVITDQRMPGMPGQDLLVEVRRLNPELSVLVMTAYGSIEDAVEAMRRGAFSYITKPVDLEALLPVLERALEHRRLLGENRSLRERLERFEDPRLIGDSPAMRAVLDLISRCAPTPSTVLITGESGTGKELAARALHRASERADAPFVPVNIAAIPESLLESELFGHEKGAFTGAQQQRIGVVERANRGTLFIDEIGDMPLQAQVKLLRMLQERLIERVGGSRSLEVDIRIIAATHQPLEELVATGRFRKDLFYRINVMRIELPPLRERREDIPALARDLLARSCQSMGRGTLELHPRSIDRMLAWEWPGNVRELANVMERAAVLCRGEAVLPEDLGLSLDHEFPADAHSWLDRDDIPLPRRLDEIERSIVLAALQNHGGNRSAAARELGLSEKNIRDRLRRWEQPAAGTDLA